MKIEILLPNYFKKIGMILIPFGLVIWCLTQLGYFNNILKNQTGNTISFYSAVLIISFFSFLIGLYFLVFVKEKQEDEFIANIRLLSFQRASFLQFVYFLFAFLYMLIFKKEPSGDAGLEMFLIISILSFWLFYVLHFNISLFLIKKKANEEQS
jgi:hypothetical protein